MSREATFPPAAVNVLDVSSKSMAAFQVFMYGRFWVFTEADGACRLMIMQQGNCRAKVNSCKQALSLKFRVLSIL